MVAGIDVGTPPRVNESRIDSLERESRLPELAHELASAAALADGAERAQLLARLGEVRLRLDDIARAILVFRESLELDPNQAVSRRWLEVLLSEPEHALEAAEVLEPIFEREYRKEPHSASMLLALLELRANRTADADERIAIWVQVGAIFDHAAAPVERLRDIATRTLRRMAVEWPGGVAKWIERVTRLAEGPEQCAAVLSSALDQPLTEPSSLQELGIAAGEALSALGRRAEALACYERALSCDPSSPEVIARIDALASEAGDGLDLRIARYVLAIEQVGEPQRRASLLYALGNLQQSAGDTSTALQSFQRALRDAPGLLRAHDALLSAYGEVGDVAAVQGELERVLPHLEPLERRAAWLRLVDSLALHGRRDEALEHCRALLDESELEEAAFEHIERLAEETRDLACLRKLHEKRIETAVDRSSRARALERLGDFFSEWQRDPSAAARAWKAAAELCQDTPVEAIEAQRLYGRALAAEPNDGESARRLVELFASSGDWGRLPESVAALLRAAADRAELVPLLLSLEARAAQAGAAAEFTSSIDDVLEALGDGADKLAVHALLAAKARSFAAAARFEDAARVYEESIQRFAEEKDVLAYVGVVEASPAAAFRHAKRRWLFEWRTARSSDPTAVLLHWATVEEQEFGDLAAAVALLERAVQRDASRPEVWRELARLKLLSDEVEAGFAALTRLRGLVSGDAVRVVELAMADVLLERLEQPLEALVLLQSALTRAASDAEVRGLALKLARQPKTCFAAVELFERATEADAPAERAKACSQLLAATSARLADVEGLGALRRRWYQQWLELCSADEAQSVVERAASEFPSDESIWAAVEELALRAREPLAAVRAYQAALERCNDAAVGETLGLRLLRFADEHVDQPRALVPALERVLTLVSGARWAFERVKYALSTDQRWSALFPLYDQTIAVAASDDERAALLDEAAIAARDVASDGERAIGYWQHYFALRPGDARVDLALERLYERQKRTRELIAHLLRRENAGNDGLALRERIAGLWLEVREGGAALALIERLPETSATEPATLQLLERVFALQLADDASAEAVERQRQVERQAARALKQRYRALKLPNEVARIALAELSHRSESEERVLLLRELAALQSELGDSDGEFVSEGELLLLEPEAAEHRARLEALAERLERRATLAELLVEAAERVKGSALFPELLGRAAELCLSLGLRERAVELFARIVEESDEQAPKLAAARALESLLFECARYADRCAVLERIAGLDTRPAAQREALLEAARVALEELHDAPRSARAFQRLLEREPEDRSLLDGWVRSLNVAESWEELVVALLRRAALEAESPRARRDLAQVARVHAERLGRADDAIATWRTIRQRFGSDGESFEALSALLEGGEKWEELCALLLEEASTATPAAPLYARLAEVHRRHTGDQAAALLAYVSAGDAIAAASLLGEVPALLGEAARLPLELSLALEQQGEKARAEALLRKQLEHYGPRRPAESVQVHLRLAELLVGAGRSQDALAELKLSVERHPSSAPLLAALGELSFEQSAFDAAEQSYRALLLLLGQGSLASGPGLSRAEVHLRLSDVAQRKQNPAQAEDQVASAFEAALGSEFEALSLERGLRLKGRQDLLERAISERLERTRDPGKMAAALGELLDVSTIFGELDAVVSERALRTAERGARELEQSADAPATACFALVEIFERLGQRARARALLENFAERGSSARDQNLCELQLARRSLLEPATAPEGLNRLWACLQRDATQGDAWDLLLGSAAERVAPDKLLALIATQLSEAQTRGDSARAEALRLRQADLLERFGRPERALEVYRSLVAEEASRTAALRSVARLLESLQAPTPELADALEALLGSERGRDAALLAARLAELRRELGDAAGVERALEKGLFADPTHVALVEALWSLHARRGSWEGAALHLQRAVGAAPRDASLKLRLAEALWRSGDIEPALATLDAALSAGASEPEVRRQRARVLEKAGRAEAAMNELDAAQALHGELAGELCDAIERTDVWQTSERWALRGADLHAEAGRRAQARRYLQHWAERHPESVPVLSRLGKLAALDRNFELAIDVYRKLSRLEQGPAQRGAALALARVCEAAGKPEAAIAEVERALSSGGESAELRRELGKLYAQSGARGKQAQLLLQEARAAKTASAARAELVFRAVELFLTEQAFAEALAALDALSTADAERVDTVCLRARVLAEQGSLAEARAFLARYLSADARRSSKPFALVYRKLAELHLQDDEWAEALEPLMQAHQLDKGDLDSALLLGTLAFDLDELELASAALRVLSASKEAPSEDPRRRRKLARGYGVLAQIELARGQRGAARRQAARAVEVDPSDDMARRLLAELNAVETPSRGS